MTISDILVAFDIIFLAIDITMMKEFIKNLLYLRKKKAVFLTESGQKGKIIVQVLLIAALLICFVIWRNRLFTSFDQVMYIVLIGLLALWYALSVDYAFVTQWEIITRKRRVKAENVRYILSEKKLVIYERGGEGVPSFSFDTAEKKQERLTEVMGENYRKMVV